MQRLQNRPEQILVPKFHSNPKVILNVAEQSLKCSLDLQKGERNYLEIISKASDTDRRVRTVSRGTASEVILTIPNVALVELK